MLIMEKVITAGLISGNTTRQNSINELQPSMIAASSISRGTDLVAPKTRKILIGKLNAQKQTAKPQMLFIRCMALATLANGIITAWKGIAIEPIISR